MTAAHGNLTPLETVLAALEDAGCRPKRKGPRQVLASCPVPGHGAGHGDRNPSLSVTEGQDGTVLVKCHAGCHTDDVLTAAGLMARDLFADTVERRNVTPLRPTTPARLLTPPAPVTPSTCTVDVCKKYRQIEARDQKADTVPECVTVYRYTDAAGTPVGEVHRWTPKTFRPFTYTDDGNLRGGGTLTVPYALPQVLEVLSRGGTVLVVEGEKDADTVNRYGLPDLAATTNSGGAGKWTDTHSEHLRAAVLENGGTVRVIGDNDTAGRGHAEKTADSLGQVLGTRPAVLFPTRGKDVTEHLENGGQLDELRETPPTYSRLGPLLTVEDLEGLPPIRRLVDGYLSTPSAAVLVGEYGVGKSALTLSLALSVATGTPFLGHTVRRERVLYVVGEGARGLPRRVRAWRETWQRDIPADAFRILSRPAESLRNPATWQELAELCQVEGFGLVILDTLSSLAPDADETKDAAVVMAGLNGLAETINGTALLVHHPGHGHKDRARGGYQLEGNVDEVLIAAPVADASDVFTVKVKKRKDGAAGEVHMLRRLVVDLDELDEDGRPVTSVTVQHAGTADLRAQHKARILAHLEDLVEPLGPSEIAKALGVAPTNGAFHRALRELAEVGKLEKLGTDARPTYRVPLP